MLQLQSFATSQWPGALSQYLNSTLALVPGTTNPVSPFPVRSPMSRLRVVTHRLEVEHG